MRVISSGEVFEDELEWLVYLVKEDQQLIGFIESSLRQSYEGCESSPVGVIEGWYIDLNHRKQGIGKQLVTQAENWAKEKGCQEMVSDVEFDNSISLEAHEKLGYSVIDQDDESYILRKRFR